MVNDPKWNLSPHPAGKYDKSSKKTTRPRHQANEGKSSVEAEMVQALGALPSLRLKKKVVVEK